MIRPLLPSLALVCVLSGSASAADPAEPQIAQGKHAEALAAWEAAAKSEAGDPKAALELALRLAYMQDADHDVQAYERSVALLTPAGGADLVEALGGLATQQAWHGRFDDARASAAKAIAAAGSDSTLKARGTCVAGEVELSAGGAQAAQAKFKEAEMLAAGAGATGELVQAWTGQGRVLTELGDWKGALKILKKATKSGSQVEGDAGILAHEAMAIAFYEAGDPLAAAKARRAQVAQAMAAKNSSPTAVARAKLALAERLASIGEFAEAKTLADEAVGSLAEVAGEGSAAHAMALVVRGSGLALYGDYAAAAKDVEAGMATLRSSATTYPDLPDAISYADQLTKVVRPTFARVMALQEAVALSEKLKGPEHPATGWLYRDLGWALAGDDDYGAHVAFERARRVFVACYGESHPSVMFANRGLDNVLDRLDLDDPSVAAYETHLPLAEAILGKKNVNLRPYLEDYADQLNELGLHDQAAKLHLRALALAKRGGDSSPDALTMQYELADHLYDRELLKDSLDTVSEALAAEQATFAPSNTAIARALNFVALNQDKLGDNASAKKNYEDSIAIYAAAGMPVIRGEGTSRRNLAGIHTEDGKHEEAKLEMEKALRVFEAYAGPEDTTDVDFTLQLYSAILSKTNQATRGSRAFARQVEMNDKLIGARDIPIGEASALASVALAVPGGEALAEAAVSQMVAQLFDGEWNEAGLASEMMYRALALHLEGRTTEAAILTDAALDRATANFTRPPNERGEITVTPLDFESAGHVRILGAIVLARQGDKARAAQVLASAKEAFAGSPRQGSYTALQGTLATGAAWSIVGDTSKAQAELESATKTYEATQLNNASELTAALTLLSIAWQRAEQPDKSTALLDKATKACDEAARCASVPVAFAMTLAAQERKAAADASAAALAQRAMDLWEQDIDIFVAGLSEDEEMAWAQARSFGADLLMSLDAKDDTLVFGSVLKSEAASNRAVFHEPTAIWEPKEGAPMEAIDRVLDLEGNVARYATVPFDPAQGEIRRFRVDQLIGEVKTAQGSLVKADPVYAGHVAALEADRARICDAMPSGSVLVHTRKDQAGSGKYEAFVLRAAGCSVDRAELGSISDVDAAVIELRRAAMAKDATAYAKASADVAKLVWKPLDAKVGGARNVFVVPDGALSGVSFAGLPSATGYLVESHAFSYLDAPGDVVRWKESSARSATDALVYAQPDPWLNLLRADLPQTLQTTGGVAFCEDLSFPAVGASVPTGAKTGADAIEASVKAAGALVFLTPLLDSVSCIETRPSFGETVTLDVNPATTVGIALSGHGLGVYNSNGHEDGIWTADEIAHTDLRSTHLLFVGGGDDAPLASGARTLYGAAARSGARTMVLPLWSVDQIPDSLVASMSTTLTPGATLRQAQLAALGTAEGKSAPWTWAAWVAAGDWR